MKTPNERYDHDVAGMPVFAANDKLMVVVGPNAMKSAVPQDDEHCAIAEACLLQLESPYVSVGRTRTDIAQPHPKGVVKQGYGETKWAVIRYRNSGQAKDLIIRADTGKLDLTGEVVQLRAPGPADRPEAKRARNKTFRTPKGNRAPRPEARDARKDVLTEMGVRTLTGQRSRFTT